MQTATDTATQTATHTATHTDTHTDTCQQNVRFVNDGWLLDKDVGLKPFTNMQYFILMGNSVLMVKILYLYEGLLFIDRGTLTFFNNPIEHSVRVQRVGDLVSYLIEIDRSSRFYDQCNFKSVVIECKKSYEDCLVELTTNEGVRSYLFNTKTFATRPYN